jgi:ABC-type polysaccharide/polyol phosphate transport system ATPase subunit
MERIIIENLNKEFKIGLRIQRSALSRLASFLNGRESKKIIKVIDNVSLRIVSGEMVGIIGTNGSGKSTLLRIIAGIYKQDSGKVSVKGNVISLINLYVGLKERLTMKENIFLVGSLFGLEQKEIKEKFDVIVKFSGLGEFVNTKLYQFSEGMKQRLSFSVAINANPDVLLLDEVFEIGDEDFKEKSVKKIKEMISAGACVVLVSHDLEVLKKHCSRVMWIEKGKIKETGDSKEIIEKYQKNKA